MPLPRKVRKNTFVVFSGPIFYIYIQKKLIRIHILYIQLLLYKGVCLRTLNNCYIHIRSYMPNSQGKVPCDIVRDRDRWSTYIPPTCRDRPSTRHTLRHLRIPNCLGQIKESLVIGRNQGNNRSAPHRGSAWQVLPKS